MKEKRIMGFGTVDKPAHGVYHVLPGRNASFLVSIVCKNDNISRIILPLVCESHVVNC